MAMIKCIASGSTGNCYIVQLGSGCFILDAGVSIEKINKEINLNNVDFCFISHNHKDHSKSFEKLVFRGVEIIEGKLIGGFEKIALNGRFRAKYSVLCFPVEHGEEKNGGIIVISKETNECLLYVTDFNICKYDIKKWLEYFMPGAKLTHVMVECNYCDDLITLENEKAQRQINTHMSLNGLQLFLDKLDLTKCKEILLLHISQTYGDSIVMASTIYSRYKIKTGICKQWGGIDYYG